jgi:MFS family permease
VTSVNQDSVAITPAYRWLIVISGLSGTLVVIFSATMINVAVPSIMGAYGVGQDLAQWAATAYIATMVIGQLMNNWLVSAIGERYAFCVLLVLFTSYNPWCWPQSFRFFRKNGVALPSVYSAWA